MNQTHFRSN